MLRDYGWQAMNNFHYVYLLRSLSHPNQIYIGLTSDIEARLNKHNQGGCTHTAKYTPWKIETATAFRSKDKAVAFERYLKSGSGREFSRRHF